MTLVCVACAAPPLLSDVNWLHGKLWGCNQPYLRIPQSHKYTKRMTDYDPRLTNPLSGSTSYLQNEIITRNAFYYTISVKHASNVVTNLEYYAHARDL